MRRRLVAVGAVVMLAMSLVPDGATALQSTGADDFGGISLLGVFRSKCLDRNERGICQSRVRGGPMAFEGRRFVTQGWPGFGSFATQRREPYVTWQSAYWCAGFGRSISLWRGFVIESARYNSDVSTKSCNNTDDSAGKHGLRIVDVRDPLHPRQVKFLETNCHSLDHSFFPVGRIVYIYDVYELPACTGTTTDPEPLYMRVFKLDPERPRRARLVSEPASARTEACNRLFVHVERALLACTSLNRVVLFDLSDPVNPEPLGVAAISDVVDFVGEASFSWDGNQFLVEDGCSLFIIDVSDPSAPVEASRLSSADEGGNCVGSVGSIGVLPTKDADLRMAVVGWGEEGLTVVDFSDPVAPVKRELYSEDIDWAYWYNGRIYAWASDPGRGLVLRLRGANRQTVHFFKRFSPHTQYADFKS